MLSQLFCQKGEALKGFLEFLTYKESEFDIKLEFLGLFLFFSLRFVKGFNYDFNFFLLKFHGVIINLYIGV